MDVSTPTFLSETGFYLKHIGKLSPDMLLYNAQMHSHTATQPHNLTITQTQPHNLTAT